MLKKDLMSEIQDIFDLELLKNTSLKKLTTINVEAWGDLIIIRSENALKKLLVKLKKNNIAFHVIGWGANQILPKSYEGFYLKLNLPFDKKNINWEKSEINLPASVPLSVLTSIASKLEVDGWEVFTGIPATLGGAVFMNAGTALGEIGSLVKEVKLVDSQGVEKWIDIKEGYFLYRKNTFLNPGEIITRVTLKNKGRKKGLRKVITNYLKLVALASILISSG